MKVVSPATTSVLRFVSRSENLKKVLKVEVSPLAYAQVQYSSRRLQATGFRLIQGNSLPATTRLRAKTQGAICAKKVDLLLDDASGLKPDA